MAIHQEQVQQIQGFDKEIEASAMGLIFDNLQRSQYQYPQKSAVRELVSNALDAIREKQIAVDILNGSASVEDHFLKRDDPMYKDSNFNPDYYDPEWLWTSDKSFDIWNKSPNTVYVTYIDGGNMEKDRIIIEDFGVGLGGRRLEGYFKLGYSTKRNTKLALGKFGIGAKAALATASHYTMSTRYNGREYKFQIYNDKIISITPEWDMETSLENPSQIFSNGAVIYYRNTTLPNGTTIEIESKKHHKQLYIDAVKSQLLYFDNVEFRIQNTSGSIDIIPIKAEVLYEDDYIVLSDNNQFSKPHLLINKVNYGYVDFAELELENKQGNIGIKVAAEDVNVNQSRESVMWDDKTRETVIKQFRKVQDIAGHMVSEQLQTEDFLEWITSCAQLSGRYANSNSIIGRLSRIVEFSSIKPKFSRDETIRYNWDYMSLLEFRKTTLSQQRTGSTIKYKINRNEIEPDVLAMGLPIVVMSGRANFRKDKYLLENVYPDGFISIKLKYSKVDETEEEENNEELNANMLALADKLKVDVGEFRSRLHRMEDYIVQSKNYIPYDSVIVPDNFDDAEDVETTESEEEAILKCTSLAERRKLTGTIPIHTPRVIYSEKCNDTSPIRLYEWQKLEQSVEGIDNWSEDEVFYATDRVLAVEADGTETLESNLLHLAAMLTRPFDNKFNVCDHYDWRDTPDALKEAGVSYRDANRCTHFFDTNNTRLKLIKIAQSRQRLFSDFKPIQQFFLDIKNKVLTMSNALIRWNTGRIINEQLPKLKYLKNFGPFHGRYQAMYEALVNYVQANYRDIGGISNSNKYLGTSQQIYDDLITHCDKVTKLQLLVRDHKDDPEFVAKAVKEMFNPEQEVVDAAAIDIVFYDKLMELLDYSAPINTLFNEMPMLTSNGTISEELESRIREYMSFKGVATE